MSETLLGQDQGTILGHSHTMLKVGAPAAVGCYGCPLVVEHRNIRLARVHHRFNGENHAFFQPRTLPTGTEIRNLRLLVQAGTDAVSHKIAYHAEAVGLDHLLHRGTDIADGLPDLHGLNSALQRSLGYFHQLL